MLQSEYCVTEVAARVAWHLEELEWCKARETQLQVVSHFLMLLVNKWLCSRLCMSTLSPLPLRHTTLVSTLHHPARPSCRIAGISLEQACWRLTRDQTHYPFVLADNQRNSQRPCQALRANLVFGNCVDCLQAQKSKSVIHTMWLMEVRCWRLISDRTHCHFVFAEHQRNSQGPCQGS